VNCSFNETIKTTKKMKKVIGYIRVSTEYQKIKGNSVKNQIQSIKNYCSVNDLELVKIYEDKGISGMSNTFKILKISPQFFISTNYVELSN
jgi:DNA invertase Pin-like site-specific DNA recombinase